MQRNIQDYFSISHSSSYFDGSILNNMEYFRGLFCLAFYSDFFGFVQDRGIFKIISTSHSSSYFDRWILNNMEYFRGLFCLQNNQKIQETHVEEYSRLFQYLICHHILTDRSSIIWNTFVVFFAWHFIRISLDLFKIRIITIHNQLSSLNMCQIV